MSVKLIFIYKYMFHFLCFLNYYCVIKLLLIYAAR